ncbi:U3 small nucleolar RNA-associated protein 6-domain-containing protein [Tribonema minus]|uniref:U3 small nucleolar RNA-associated protein 6-domain-containing protein n=1 Tax=Tribonema minus TaxID=303371 RepID=A0A835YXJ8_9STRA|nr:U3 small nucleolar RNA-associated protein 6-domain-containing protein [Tribonema minus]
MGDTVQAVMDRMVPDLEDMQRKGVFTREEVRAIAARRRDHEYLARRRQARKVDFLRYIEYELNLEILRKIRRKKFPGDVSLCLQHIDFAAKQTSTKILSRIFGRALQLHPHNAGLWIKAASWEFFDCANAVAARVLLQRALRINGVNQRLWVQYFRLEWCYLQKVIGRQQVLGLIEDDSEGGEGVGDAGGLDIPEVQGEGESSGPDFSQVAAAEQEEGKASQKKRSASRQVVMSDATKQFYKGGVPLAIFRAARKALPDDIALRGHCLQVCCTEFPELSKHVQSAILDSLKEDFPASAEAWALRAQHPLLVLQGYEDEDLAAVVDAEGQCIQAFEAAVKSSAGDGADIWLQYSQFLHARLSEADVSRAVDLSAVLEGVLQRAVNQVLCTAKAESGISASAQQALPELTLQYASLLLHAGGRDSDVRAVLEKTREVCPADVNTALFLAALLQREALLANPSSESGHTMAQEVLRSALKAQPSPSSPGIPRLWQAILELLQCAATAGSAVDDDSDSDTMRDEIQRAYKDAITACAHPDHGHHEALADFVKGYHALLLESEGLTAASAALQWCCDSFGLRAAAGADAMTKRGGIAIVMLHTIACTAYTWCGTVELWNAYHDFELQEGKPQAAAAIAWRAQQQGISLTDA